MAEDQPPPCRGCGTMQVHRRLLDTDPGYARRLARIEEHAFRVRMGMQVLRPGCTEIPVVVHVVYRTTEQNISQAQIDTQIEVLNKDFRKQNADIGSVPAPFAPLAGDARLQFRLATADPDGNPTDGVTRTQTNKNAFDSSDEVKFSASGGHDAWPRDEYLNIWVCQLAGGLLGYAQFPGGPAETDGVVVTHTGFGTTGTARAPFNKGRTTTHELGHWLNLRHIWGDDGDGCSGSDFVSDTPNQGGPNTGKPTFPSISCNNGPNGDMFMNYMDYVDDDVMVMFSEGQIQRMHACLDGARSAIGRSVPCVGVAAKPVFKDGPKDPIKDRMKEPPKDLPKDPPKDFAKDLPKDFPKEPAQDPKPFWGDPGKLPADPPKSIFEPPKGWGDPPKGWGEPPKSMLEPPVEGPFGPGAPPVMPPFAPPQPQPVPSAQPFVLGTGAPAAAAMGMPGADLQQHYALILGQYAGLYQRGLLDQQGLAAWQQAWAAYRQAGGQ